MENFNLTPLFDEGTKTYKLANYDAILKSCETFCEETTKTYDTEITDKEHYDGVADKRTEVRKQIKEIGDIRKKITRAIIGEFADNLSTLEKKLTAVDKTLKARVDAFDAKKEAETAPKEPKTYNLTITSFSRDAINEVKKFAKEKGCGVTEG